MHHLSGLIPLLHRRRFDCDCVGVPLCVCVTDSGGGVCVGGPLLYVCMYVLYLIVFSFCCLVLLLFVINIVSIIVIVIVVIIIVVIIIICIIIMVIIIIIIIISHYC